MGEMTMVDVLLRVLESSGGPDGDLEGANVVEAIVLLGKAVRAVGWAITADATPGRDANGGLVGSLTEAAMGITAALHQVASGLSEIADAIREGGE